MWEGLGSALIGAAVTLLCVRLARRQEHRRRLSEAFHGEIATLRDELANIRNQVLVDPNKKIRPKRLEPRAKTELEQWVSRALSISMGVDRQFPRHVARYYKFVVEDALTCLQLNEDLRWPISNARTVLTCMLMDPDALTEDLVDHILGSRLGFPSD